MTSASWNITARPEEVAGIRRAAVRFSRTHGVPEERLADLQLALSEAMTNAVVHAFRDRGQPGTVTVSVNVTPGAAAEVVVRDNGIGMYQRSDSPGLGLGLGLIERVADQVEHRSPDDGIGFELWMYFRLVAD